MRPKKSGTFQSFDGTPIYYEVRGEGPPLVFVYGIACLMNHWHHQADYFSKDYQVILFDLRGHHKSRSVGSENELTIEAIAKDMALLLKHLQLKTATFVGHSFGVPAILEAYHQNPKMFDRIVLVNGFATNPLEKTFGFNVMGPAFSFIKTQYESSPEFWSSLWNELSYNQVSMYIAGLMGGFNLKLTAFQDIEIYARGVAKMDFKVFLKFFEELMKFEGEDYAKEIKCPTLIIAGDKDQITPMNFQRELHHLVKKSEFFVVPYGSHCSQLDFPEYINLKMNEFLDKTTRKTHHK